MNRTRLSEPEQLLRELAFGDEALLRTVLVLRPAAKALPATSVGPTLPPATRALVHLGAMLAAGGSTTSLRWAVEGALQAGVEEHEIAAVLTTVAAVVGAARVVASAPRLALAVGYDIEVEGWDGD